MDTRSLIIYENQAGDIKIDVRLEDESVWLTQEQMALLFGKGRSTITEHILNHYRPMKIQLAHNGLLSH